MREGWATWMAGGTAGGPSDHRCRLLARVVQEVEGSPVYLGTSTRVAGAIDSLVWRDKEFINRSTSSSFSSFSSSVVASGNFAICSFCDCCFCHLFICICTGVSCELYPPPSWDHGRQLQSALTLSGWGECWNPTEVTLPSLVSSPPRPAGAAMG